MFYFVLIDLINGYKNIYSYNNACLDCFVVVFMRNFKNYKYEKGS